MALWSRRRNSLTIRITPPAAATTAPIPASIASRFSRLVRDDRGRLVRVVPGQTELPEHVDTPVVRDGLRGGEHPTRLRNADLLRAADVLEQAGSTRPHRPVVLVPHQLIHVVLH